MGSDILPVHRGAEGFQERLKDKLEGNAEYQRRKQMTTEEKAREAKDRSLKAAVEHEKRMGNPNPYPAAERKVEDIVRRYANDKG